MACQEESRTLKKRDTNRGLQKSRRMYASRGGFCAHPPLSVPWVRLGCDQICDIAQNRYVGDLEGDSEIGHSSSVGTVQTETVQIKKENPCEGEISSGPPYCSV